ncbi:MAG: NAD(P)-dependent oxidoreductase [Trueperaceae bacterium]|nr:MAG: NAD(P)-dependent oxidoreductase [Trueperaceae bacterium]
MKRIVVTGGRGRIGRAIVEDLLEHGFEVMSVDLTRGELSFDPNRALHWLKADLSDYGQTVEALGEADGIVHMAAIPASGIVPEPLTFEENIKSTYNVFHAAIAAGLKRVVWASTVQVFGIPFTEVAPDRVPLVESMPLRGRSSYALSKSMGEDMARYLSDRSGVSFAGLRFAWVTRPGDYQNLPLYWQHPEYHADHFWSYVDARDAAQACRKALSADFEGAEAFSITAAETMMNRTTSELMAEHYPAVSFEPGAPFASLYDISKARRILGYEPEYRWRDLLDVEG